MKTLDEVIKGFECCQEINCAECPYANWDNTDVVHCNDTEKEDDALHYLREYRTEQKILSDSKEHYEYWEHKYYAELEKNDPLTWDELKAMEEKPVWIEEKNSFNKEWRGRWEVICSVWDNEWDDDPYLSMTNEEYRHKDDMGERWQAYRKERYENA